MEAAFIKTLEYSPGFDVLTVHLLKLLRLT